jgi:sorbitol-specific phosphotransferase system component IIBC
MKMKKILLGIALVAFGANLNAQTLKDEIQYVQEHWGKEKKTLVMEALKLNTEAGNKFWPLYDEYQVSRKKLGEDRIMAIKNYADNYETMTDSKATEIANQILKNDKAMNKLMTDYLKKMSKAVGAIKAVQFLQVEGYLDNQIKAAISDALPFMPDPKQ